LLTLFLAFNFYDTITLDSAIQSGSAIRLKVNISTFVPLIKRKMTSQQKSSTTLHISLWIAQGILAAFFLTGVILKFQSIEKTAAMMPWVGQVPPLLVRSLGVIDLLGAIGLILPSLLRIKPQVTSWTALCIIALMICAIIFHVSRGEAAVIGVNICCIMIASFIAWGRFKK
jgi:uncharacterized membrane protein